MNVVMKNMCEIKSNLIFLTNTKYCPFNVHCIMILVILCFYLLRAIFWVVCLSIQPWSCQTEEATTWRKGGFPGEHYFNIKSQFDEGERDLFQLKFSVATWCFFSGSHSVFFMRKDGCNFCKKRMFEQQSQCNISCKWLRKNLWKNPMLKSIQ